MIVPVPKGSPEIPQQIVDLGTLVSRGKSSAASQAQNLSLAKTCADCAYLVIGSSMCEGMVGEQ